LKSNRWKFCAFAVVLAFFGCERPVAPIYRPSKVVAALSEKVRKQIHDELEKYSGTPIRPKLIGATKIDSDRLAHGAEVYRLRCAACHGVTGDGDGPAAKYMHPLPRDYRLGVFKFTSTQGGQKALRDDLLRTIRRGARGTSMPSFNLLPDEDQQALVDYVLVLTHRGELEMLLAQEGESEGEIDPANVQDYVKSIVQQWENAKQNQVHPKTAEPPYSRESVRIGREAFVSNTGDCFKCHDKDGSARITESVGMDPWGKPARAADITSGMLHGGATSEDLYRRIHSGITPMPSFALKYAEQPDMIWHLVHYVQFTAGERRRQVLEQQQLLLRNSSATEPSSAASGAGR